MDMLHRFEIRMVNKKYVCLKKKYIYDLCRQIFVEKICYHNNNINNNNNNNNNKEKKRPYMKVL